MSAEEGLAIRAVLRPGVGDFNLDMQFELPPGITTMFGPSGAGKSTAIAIISGLLRPDQGQVQLRGRVLFDSRTGIDVPVHQRRIAVVFQSPALFPHMTVLRNVAYGVPRRMPRAERDETAQVWLGRMRVSQLAHRRPGTLSGGEIQRVALARALASQPDLLLLDEAFSALDLALRRELQQDVLRFVEDARIPAVQVTHQREDIRAMGDRVLLVERGRIAAQGTAAELLAGG